MLLDTVATHLVGPIRVTGALVRAKKKPHIALSNYQSFMASTDDIRGSIEESAAAAEQEIDMLIDRARGK